MGGKIRVEVSDEFGTVAEILDPAGLLGNLSTRHRGRLQALASTLIGDLAAVLGAGEQNAAEAAVAVLTRQVADEAAYERVAARKRDAAELQGRLF